MRRSSSSRIDARGSTTRASSRGSTSGSTTRCRKVVELGMQWEDRKREWESEREEETLRAAEDKLRIVREWEAYIELTEARDAQHEALAAQMREYVSRLVGLSNARGGQIEVLWFRRGDVIF